MLQNASINVLVIELLKHTEVYEDIDIYITRTI